MVGLTCSQPSLASSTQSIQASPQPQQQEDSPRAATASAADFLCLFEFEAAIAQEDLLQQHAKSGSGSMLVECQTPEPVPPEPPSPAAKPKATLPSPMLSAFTPAAFAFLLDLSLDDGPGAPSCSSEQDQFGQRQQQRRQSAVVRESFNLNFLGSDGSQHQLSHGEQQPHPQQQQWPPPPDAPVDALNFGAFDQWFAVFDQ